jgi:dienelactone hydrolase
MLLLFSLVSGCKDTEIIGEPVDYTADNIVLKGYLAYDNGIRDKRPGILVVHEWWGHDEYARNRARMLAGLGYTALAVDMYGEGKQAEHPKEAAQFAKEVSENMDLKKARFMAAMDILKQHRTVDPERIAAIGYCFGGAIVLEMARTGAELDGVVSFHGGLSTKNPAQPGAVKAKILVCHGEKDFFTSSQKVTVFKQEMKKAGADLEFIRYKNAAHSFTNPESNTYAKEFKIPVGYNAEADKKSWADMQRFLKELFKK